MLEQVVEQGEQFVGLDAVVAFLVEQIGAVARPCACSAARRCSALVLFREEPGLAPALDDARDDLAVFFVVVMSSAARSSA
jgi:hypothetical protein